MRVLKVMFWTMLVAMIPAIEIKGAIPFGIAFGIHPALAYVAGLLGSSIVLVVIAFVIQWFYSFCKRHNIFKHLIGWFDKMVNKNREKLEKWGPWFIFAYVAIPVPGTGTWTGAIIAGILEMKPVKIIRSVFCGNIISGIIMTIIGTGVSGYTQKLVTTIAGMISG